MNVCSLLPCALWTNTFKIRICRMFGVAFSSTCAALVRLHSKSRKMYNRNGFCHSPKTPNKYENVQSRPVTCTPVSHSFGEAFRLRWSDGVNESSATHEMRPDFSVINHKVIRRTKKTYMNDNDHPSLLAPSILPKFKFFFSYRWTCDRCEFLIFIWLKWIVISCDTIEAVAESREARVTRRRDYETSYETHHDLFVGRLCDGVTRCPHLRAHFTALNHFRSICATHIHLIIVGSRFGTWHAWTALVRARFML